MIALWGAKQFDEQATKGSIKEGNSVWVRSETPARRLSPSPWLFPPRDAIAPAAQ